MTNNVPQPATPSAFSSWTEFRHFWRRQNAHIRTSIDNAYYNFQRFALKRGGWLTLGLLAFGFVVSAALVAMWISGAGSHFEYKLTDIADIYRSGGSALFGAAAIVSSIVLFSVQVNAERTPYGMFRKLASDRLLLSLFGYSFVMSGAIVVASGFVSQSNAPWLNFFSAWAVATTLIALLWSYRRALALISPIQQINITWRRILKVCRIWDRSAERTRPVFE